MKPKVRKVGVSRWECRGRLSISGITFLLTVYANTPFDATSAFFKFRLEVLLNPKSEITYVLSR